jgi:multicomponent Na+:H+ antiporter subunit C
METLLVIVVGAFFAVSIYLILSKHLVRILIGVVILGNAVNLLIFTAGRLTAANPPIIRSTETVLAREAANPLPQALILTAIVISFSIFAFLLVLAFRTYQDLATDDVDEMRVAEPRPPAPPVIDY